MAAEKKNDLSDKEVKKKKVGMLQGIQARVLAAMLLTAVICVAFVMEMAIRQSKEAMTERLMGDMLTMVDAYGINMETAAYTMGNDVPKAEGMQAMYAGVKLEGIPSSYIYVVDSDGIMLMHPTESKVGEPVENEVVIGLVKQLQSGIIPESNVTEYEYRGVDKLAAYYVMKNGRAILVLTADKEDAFGAINDFAVQCVIGSAVVLPGRVADFKKYRKAYQDADRCCGQKCGI